MPEEAALVEFAVFRPFDPKAERNAEAYGPPHYAAYVIRKHGSPAGQDLGPSKAIDEIIDALRQALRDPARTDLKQRARALDERVMRPLRESFGDATRLLISPDGDLNLVPFEALVGEDGRYLIERYATSYLTSGRDLLRLRAASTTQSTAVVIVADPMFGEPGTTDRRQTLADDVLRAAGRHGGRGPRDQRALPRSRPAHRAERNEGCGRTPGVAAHSAHRLAWIFSAAAGGESPAAIGPGIGGRERQARTDTTTAS